LKTIKEIKEEISFQESEYDRIKKIVKNGFITEEKRRNYFEIMGRHSARREALLWTISP
jgi:predicted transcriptional regulator